MVPGYPSVAADTGHSGRINQGGSRVQDAHCLNHDSDSGRGLLVAELVAGCSFSERGDACGRSPPSGPSLRGDAGGRYPVVKVSQPLQSIMWTSCRRALALMKGERAEKEVMRQEREGREEGSVTVDLLWNLSVTLSWSFVSVKILQ